jgi:hypothetical protein
VTLRTTAATTPTRTRKCAPDVTENAQNPNSVAETENAFPAGGGATSTTTAAMGPTNRLGTVFLVIDGASL